MPKLYYSLQRTNDPALADPWQIPGAQDKKAERVDIPSSPAELAAWLNSRRVPLTGDAFDGLVPGNAAARELLEEARVGEAGAVLSSADVDRVNAGRPAFLPRLDADEIERRRMAMNRCPKCGTSTAPLLTIEDIERWVAAGQLEELERIAHAIKDRCVADRRSLEAGGIQ